MNRIKNQSGFSHLVIVIVLVAIGGIIAFTAIRVIDTQQQKDEDNIQPLTSKSSELSSGESQIKDSSDLDTVNSSLEKTNLDSELNSEELDQDINEML